MLSGGEQTKWGVSALNVMTEREVEEEGRCRGQDWEKVGAGEKLRQGLVQRKVR